jgi:hypothetical protein
MAINPAQKISYVGIEHIAARLSVSVRVLRSLKEFAELNAASLKIGRKRRWVEVDADLWIAGFAKRKRQADLATAEEERRKDVSVRARRAGRSARRAELNKQRVVTLADYAETRNDAAA